MKIVIKKDELIDLAPFMWKVDEKQPLPTQVSPMVGEEYGKAIAHQHYFSTCIEQADYSLYYIQCDYYGPVYVLTIHHDDGENTTSEIKLLPTWAIEEIEVKD